MWPTRLPLMPVEQSHPRRPTRQAPGPGGEKIIDIPKQDKLVDTGGPPLLLAGAALLCLAGAGIVMRVLRR
jgi:hypothetical protein